MVGNPSSCVTSLRQHCCLRRLGASASALGSGSIWPGRPCWRRGQVTASSVVTGPRSWKARPRADCPAAPLAAAVDAPNKRQGANSMSPMRSLFAVMLAAPLGLFACGSEENTSTHGHGPVPQALFVAHEGFLVSYDV